MRTIFLTHHVSKEGISDNLIFEVKLLIGFSMCWVGWVCAQPAADPTCSGGVCHQPTADQEIDRIGQFRHPVGFGRVGWSQDLRFRRENSEKSMRFC